MSSILLLAQALPSASSGVDWLYQFTNNLTNLTTQNGGALTQLGMTELACISFFMLVSMVVNWQTSTMTFRLHHHPIQAGDLTKFLLQLIICCLLETYWVNPFPGASFGINHFFSYIAQAMVAAFDQSSLDSLLNLLKTAGDQTQMPSFTAPVQILCYFPCADSFGIGFCDPVPHQLQRLHPLRRHSALRTDLRPFTDDEDVSSEVLSFPRCPHRFRNDSSRRGSFHFRLGRVLERIHSADVQRQLFDGDVAG